jgi:2-iminobutanoate/2-iminopropanoate deaminase
MPTRIIATDAAPKAIGPYSQAVLSARGGARTLYCSGQIPLDPATGELVAGDIVAQTERVLENVSAVLREAGMAFSNVVKTTVYLTDLADFAKMNEVYARYLGKQPPARSTVQAAGLPRGVKIEIDLVAAY